MAHNIHDRRKDRTGKHELSIYSSGQGRFNAATVDTLLEEVEAAGFEPDPKARKLRVILNEDGQDAKRLRNHSYGRGFYVGDLLREFGICIRDIDGPVHLAIENDPDQGVLVVDVEPLLEVVDDADG